jgi:protoporphyrin/coproporphyrin ferrochelatase
MSRYRPEPASAHDDPARLGVLLINLGTPDAPTAAAVRKYLAEFLSDPRVVEIPPALWKPLLHGFILRTRPAKSARRYASIWTSDGSPLLVHSLRQKVLLQGYLGERMKAHGLPADHARVELGMRYGQPSVQDALGRLKAAHCNRIVVLPLYPQYSASTTASALDAVGAALAQLRRVPATRVVDAYHDNPAYIKALAARVNDYWMKNGRPDKLLMSFHGVPRAGLLQGDPYYCHCQKTGRLLATELGLEASGYAITFQSLFGRAEWLKPYTEPTIVALARDGVGRVDVVCPGFVSDCLETLEEVAQEVRAAFLAAGGREFHYIPCLNESPGWISTLAGLALTNLDGWMDAPADQAARERTVERAKALGAAR